MNLGAMKTALCRLAGVDLSDPLVDWINAAITEFEDAYPWPFLEGDVGGNLAAGTFAIAPPADYVKAASVHLVPAPPAQNIIHLKYKPWTQVLEEEYRTSDATIRGVPEWYTIRGTGLIVYPAADITYSYIMIYDRGEPDLVIDADIPIVIPPRYHYTLVEGAAVKALNAESEEERSATARVVFEDSIDRHITKLGGMKQSGTYNTTRDVMGYGS